MKINKKNFLIIFIILMHSLAEKEISFKELEQKGNGVI